MFLKVLAKQTTTMQVIYAMGNIVFELIIYDIMGNFDGLFPALIFFMEGTECKKKKH
jgi:hypothetical protein